MLIRSTGLAKLRGWVGTHSKFRTAKNGRIYLPSIFQSPLSVLRYTGVCHITAA